MHSKQPGVQPGAHKSLALWPAVVDKGSMTWAHRGHGHLAVVSGFAISAPLCVSYPGSVLRLCCSGAQCCLQPVKDCALLGTGLRDHCVLAGFVPVRGRMPLHAVVQAPAVWPSLAAACNSRRCTHSLDPCQQPSPACRRLWRQQRRPPVRWLRRRRLLPWPRGSWTLQTATSSRRKTLGTTTTPKAM